MKRPRIGIVSDAMVKARELGGQLRTRQQGQDAINLAGRTLRKAVDRLTAFAWIDKAVGVSSAYASRLESQIRRLGVLRERIATLPYTRAQADAIGLALVQSAAVLYDIQRDVVLSQAQSTFQSLAEEFARALRRILEAIAETAAQAVPWWGWAALVFWLARESRATTRSRGHELF